MSGNSQIAFSPLGKTVVIASAAVAPDGVQVPASDLGQSSGEYRFVNSGSNTVFLGVGSTAAVAKANAVAPIAGTPSPAVVLVPGAVEILRFGVDSFFSGLSAGATTVYVTPGTGI
jgi:hypothetical protein